MAAVDSLVPIVSPTLLDVAVYTLILRQLEIFSFSRGSIPKSRYSLESQLKINSLTSLFFSPPIYTYEPAAHPNLVTICFSDYTYHPSTDPFSQQNNPTLKSTKPFPTRDIFFQQQKSWISWTLHSSHAASGLLHLLPLPPLLILILVLIVASTTLAAPCAKGRHPLTTFPNGLTSYRKHKASQSPDLCTTDYYPPTPSCSPPFAALGAPRGCGVRVSRGWICGNVGGGLVWASDRRGSEFRKKRAIKGYLGGYYCTNCMGVQGGSEHEWKRWPRRLMVPRRYMDEKEKNVG